MSFATRLFFTIFLTSIFTLIAACSLLFQVLTYYRTQEFEQSYVDHLKLLSVALTRFEEVGDREPTRILHDLAMLDSDHKKVELLKASDKEDRKDGAYWSGDTLTVIVSTPVARLRSTISGTTHLEEVSRLRKILASLVAALAVVAFFFSKILTGFLLKKLKVIQAVVTDLTQEQDFSKRIPLVESSDELDQLAVQLNRMFEAHQKSREHLAQAERDQARAEIAAQVAHDIRSPLTSLSLGLSEIEKKIPSHSSALLKSAISRITGIVQKISKRTEDLAPSQTEVPKLTLLYPAIEAVVREHQLNLGDGKQLELSATNKDCWCVIQVVEIQTAISNLINNAFEAGATKVQVRAEADEKFLQISVADNGKGISKELMDKIFERHFTYGKASGSGLGLDQVKKALEWNDGNISVVSEPGEGTRFTMTLPSEKAPSFVLKGLQVRESQSLYFVDDDPSILEIWKTKAQGLPNRARFFSSVSDYLALPTDETGVLIIDQNLSYDQSGLELIENLKIPSVLCTWEYDDPQVQEKLKRQKVQLIPKPLLGEFKISCVS